MTTTNDIRQLIEKWFKALEMDDIEAMFECMDDNIEWINIRPVKGINHILPWICTFYGKENVGKSYNVYKDVIEIINIKPIRIVIEDEQAVCMIKETGICKLTGRNYEVEFAAWFIINNNKIVWWKSFIDPSPIIAVFKE
ncbi:MAG: nuclear transport factor 2 family protein [Nitrospirae bacterium]|nr:nuclear transport factor 2 family protein [Nitrospirota bacterium]